MPALSYPDNAKVIELLEKSPTGIFPCLDGQCKMPKASDLTFCQAIHKTHGAWALLKARPVMAVGRSNTFASSCLRAALGGEARI